VPRNVIGGEIVTAEDQEFLTIAEMQRRLKIGKSKAHSLVATRSIPSVRIGRIVRIRTVDLERWLEDHRY
jgi:excisionase family DNA binding protein